MSRSYKFRGLNVVKGCLTHGISEGCDNCSALLSCLKTAHRSRASRHVINRRNKTWNGKILFDRDLLFKKTYKRKSQNFLLPYMGEIALADPEDLAYILMAANESPQHKFLLLTKLPKTLGIKLKEAINIIELVPKNIIIGTSVESRKYLYRIRQLQKIKWFKKEVWFKPLLGSIGDIDLRGISMVRISKERGFPSLLRPFNMTWVKEIKKVASKQKVRAILER